jgi:MtN3 and saliva related transmembrane protein
LLFKIYFFLKIFNITINIINNIIDADLVEVFGLIAGIITSIGFIPQIIKGHRTKKLEDVSFHMLIVLAIGMSMWFVYGFLKEASAIVIANAIGISFSFVLIIMKSKY